MTYEEALNYIHSTPNFSRKASLERMNALMARLGNPQDRLSFVHIAGTNGKGSTAAMTASILQSAGYHTGLYISPYLERFNERIQLDGKSIPDGDLARVTEQVQDAVEAITSEGVESPNEFERVTAIAFCWYAEKETDIVVLEVGLGGRYDATNIILPPLACAITSISLDHTAVLGNTVAEIAGEKAGILKEGSVCVLSPNQPEDVVRVVRSAAADSGAELVESSTDMLSGFACNRYESTFTWEGEQYALPLIGRFQEDNVCTVLDLVRCLNCRGFSISRSAISDGLRTVQWPGRMELLAGGTVLLDCCHNPGAISALCQELDTTFHGVPITAVMGMLKDKDYHIGLRLIASRSSSFYAVSPPSPRALPLKDIQAEASAVCHKVVPCSSVEEAISLALSARESNGIVLICGSIPLVGMAREIIQNSFENSTN